MLENDLVFSHILIIVCIFLYFNGEFFLHQLIALSSLYLDDLIFQYC